MSQKTAYKVQEQVEYAIMFLCKHRLKETERNMSIRTSEYVDIVKKKEKKNSFVNGRV